MGVESVLEPFVQQAEVCENETSAIRQKRKIKRWRVPGSVATVAVRGSSSVPTIGRTELPLAGSKVTPGASGRRGPKVMSTAGKYRNRYGSGGTRIHAAGQ